MGDYAIRMQFEIDASTEAVLDALSTEEGVARWWSTAIEGTPGKKGGEFRVSFPDVPQSFEFGVEREGNRLSWRTLAFPPWWEGTTISWETRERPDGTGALLHFTHGGFDPDNEVIPIVTPAWAQIILRLKGYAETGQPDPFFALG